MNIFLNFLKGDFVSPFMPDKIQGIFDGLVGAGLGAVGGIVTNAMNANQNQFNRDFQAEQNNINRVWQNNQNRLAEQFQEKMWNMQNEYNTPSAQRKRLQEAGYNPWMSGSGSPQSLAGSAGAGSAGSPSVSSAPSNIPMSNIFGDGLNQFFTSQKVSADVANQGAKTLSELISVYREALKNGMSKDDARSLVSPFMQALSGLGSSTNRYLDLMDLDIERSRIDNEFQRSINPLLVGKTKEETAKLIQDVTESAARIGKMASDVKVNEKELQKLTSDIVRNIAESNKLGAETETLNNIRTAVVNKAITEAGLLDIQFGRESANYEQEEIGRIWQRSREGKQVGAANVTGRKNEIVNLINALLRGKTVD